LRVSLAEGEETNIKITRPVDLVIAENILSQAITGN
jgi:2-C-methyl-D-erythritol 4-phosphate cytidylyltransferase